MTRAGTGKTYASAFAMRELGFKRVLFLVHRATLATQAKNSYQRVFGNAVSMGLVGAGYHQYGKDYVFATVETLNKDAHLQKYKPDEFDCIILDEAHHSSANTYQKVSERTMMQTIIYMKYFITRLLMRFVCNRRWKRICYVRFIILELRICRLCGIRKQRIFRKKSLINLYVMSV